MTIKKVKKMIFDIVETSIFKFLQSNEQCTYKKGIIFNISKFLNF